MQTHTQGKRLFDLQPLESRVCLNAAVHAEVQAHAIGWFPRAHMDHHPMFHAEGFGGHEQGEHAENTAPAQRGMTAMHYNPSPANDADHDDASSPAQNAPVPAPVVSHQVRELFVIIFDPRAAAPPVVATPVVSVPPVSAPTHSSDSSTTTTTAAAARQTRSTALNVLSLPAISTMHSKEAEQTGRAIQVIQGVATSYVAPASQVTSLASSVANIAGSQVGALWSIVKGGDTTLPSTAAPALAAMAPMSAAARVGVIAQKAAAVVAQAMPTYFEFAHLGSPLQLLADSMAAFVEDSASIPLTSAVTQAAKPTNPWTLTAGVIAADVVVLTYMHRRKKTRAAAKWATRVIC